MIAEDALLSALEGVHSGRLRVHEAYRAIREAETPDPRIEQLLALREFVDENRTGWINADEFCEAMGLTGHGQAS